MALSDAASVAAAAAAAAATFAQALAILPAAFVLFWCLWRCRKAAAFLRLLFKDILREAAPLFLPQWQPLPVPATVGYKARGRGWRASVRASLEAHTTPGRLRLLLPFG